MRAGLGTILVVFGAVLTFVVERQTNGVDLAVAGWFLMVGGGLALLVAMIQGATGRPTSNTAMRTGRHMANDGHTYVEEIHTA